MASDDKKTKTGPAAKTETPAKKDVAPKKKDDALPKDKAAPDAAKIEAPDKAADPASGSSRGEGQKPVSQAYKDNWNAIYGKKAPKKAKK